MENEFEMICDAMFDFLLDFYQTQEWNVSWQDFITCFQNTINLASEEWKKEEISEIP